MRFKSLEYKKAEIGEGIVWLVAFLIIFFVMILFVVMAGGVAVLKDVSVLTLNNAGSSNDNLEITQELIFILESETEEGRTIKEHILESLDVYIEIYEENEPNNFFIINNVDLNNIWTVPRERIIDSFNQRKLNIGEIDEKERVIKQEILELLKSGCDSYFKLSQFLVNSHQELYESFGGNNNEDNKVANAGNIFTNNFKGKEKWSSVAVVYLPYKGYNIEVKYRKLKNCQSEENE